MSSILRNCTADPEKIRHIILVYFNKVLLGNNKQSGRAAIIIEIFRDNFYDSNNAGLSSACYGIVVG